VTARRSHPPDRSGGGSALCGYRLRWRRPGLRSIRSGLRRSGFASGCRGGDPPGPRAGLRRARPGTLTVPAALVPRFRPIVRGTTAGARRAQAPRGALVVGRRPPPEPGHDHRRSAPVAGVLSIVTASRAHSALGCDDTDIVLVAPPHPEKVRNVLSAKSATPSADGKVHGIAPIVCSCLGIRSYPLRARGTPPAVRACRA
jgi:hypothetical protein